MNIRKIAKKTAKRLIKSGYRAYGGIYEIGGQEVYMAWRKTSEIFRGGEKVLSDAVALQKASWAMDNDTLLTLRAEGIRMVGVWMLDTDDKFLTSIDAYFDNTKAKTFNYESRGGALQRYLPLEHFHIRNGTTRIR